MNRHWVADASPIILLSKANHSNLLLTCADRLLVPAVVAEEVRNADEEDPARRWMESEGQSFVEATRPVVSEVAAWDLGRGESHVLSEAHRRDGWTSVVDDGAARRCAQGLDIPVIGSLGVLVVAEKIGVIEAVRPAVEALIEAGLHVDKAVVRRVLRMADEG